jgi:hypothetical protein
MHEFSLFQGINRENERKRNFGSETSWRKADKEPIIKWTVSTLWWCEMYRNVSAQNKYQAASVMTMMSRGELCNNEEFSEVFIKSNLTKIKHSDKFLGCDKYQRFERTLCPKFRVQKWTLILVYQTTRCHILEDGDLSTRYWRTSRSYETSLCVPIYCSLTDNHSSTCFHM